MNPVGAVTIREDYYSRWCPFCHNSQRHWLPMGCFHGLKKAAVFANINITSVRSVQNCYTISARNIVS